MAAARRRAQPLHGRRRRWPRSSRKKRLRALAGTGGAYGRMDAPVAWLHRVARNLAHSHYPAGASAATCAPTRRRERLCAAAATTRSSCGLAIARLPARERDAVVLRFYVGYSVRETAAELGVPEGTVKTLTYRGVGLLRDAGLSSTRRSSMPDITSVARARRGRTAPGPRTYDGPFRRRRRAALLYWRRNRHAVRRRCRDLAESRRSHRRHDRASSTGRRLRQRRPTHQGSDRGDDC